MNNHFITPSTYTEGTEDLNESKYEMRELMFKLLVVGDYGVGKTAIIRRYTEGTFTQNYKITIGVDFAIKALPWDENTVVTLQLWDIAGHERFGYMTGTYYRHSQAAIIVFDLIRLATLDSVIKWHEDIKEKVATPNGKPLPVILLANKCDISGVTIRTDYLTQFCKKNNILAWFFTSAKENINVGEAVKYLVEKIICLQDDDSDVETIPNDSFRLSSNKIVQKKKAINNSIVMVSASPELKISKDESLNVTLNRGSDKKTRKSKRKVSFVTPLRRSTRLSVSTPRHNSVKGRPKTPMPSRLSSSTKRMSATKEGNESVACNLNLDVSETLETENPSVGKAKRPSTPMPISKQKRKKSSSSGKPHDFYGQCLESTPKVILHRLKEEDLKEISTKKTTATPVAQSDVKEINTNSPCAPGFKKIVTPFPASGKPKSVRSTPRNQEKTPLPQSSSKSSVLTPGFQKMVTPLPSYKTKTTPNNVKGIKSVSKENAPLKKKHKFDLRASLARKLPYKPHTGPLKPMNERNLNNGVSKTPLPAAKKAETKNQVVTKARIQNREVLHGVRKNKRFVLQMNNRNLDWNKWIKYCEKFSGCN